MDLPTYATVANDLDTVWVSLIQRGNGDMDVFVSACDTFHTTYLFLNVAHARGIADALLAYAAEADERNQATASAS